MRGSGVRILFAAPSPLPRTSRDVRQNPEKHCNLRHFMSIYVQRRLLTADPHQGTIAELVRLVARQRGAKRDLGQLVGRHFWGNSLFAEASYPDFYPHHREPFGSINRYSPSGGKSTQAKDIEIANAYWKDYKARLPKPPVQRGGAPAKRGRGGRVP